jgi:multidrug efflux pump subunit AcrA (membrane-fusion protein)
VAQGVVNYNVRVNLDPAETPVRLDMTANASILGEKHENVLVVPTSAIRSFGGGGQGGFSGQGNLGGQGGFSGQGGQRIQGPFVLVLENGQPRPVQVTEGLTAGDLTEVSGDLKEGDEVVITAVTRTQNGNAVPAGPGGFNPFGPPPFLPMRNVE